MKQKEMFIALVDLRYNQMNGEVTLTSEEFPTRAQNHYRLIQILRELLRESKKVE